ncbi:response regulator transcription factor [Phenylobacterium sp. 20VBR1]|uniref:Response regulator transcription factor n=1 Tax=Phenylobacterium glaciei TaxID=2803784 RepID=A0A941D0M7_9CAUL|nr:response regulator transcription factor [Phenylobacterium glaciei]MBR7619259.1 response regulator transcription factor [Phenylobacterium glaciei]QQZ51621.1 response regulator transcription factor [Phenylobacterium glaciei]
MIRLILLWALVLAGGAFALQWLQYRALTHALPLQIYVALVGAAFAAGGVWVGWKLNARKTAFEPNTAAVASLGLTRQEVKVLKQLAAGQSNKEIARTLGVSPDTVKTHAANLFSKLEVSRRTQAVRKARDLHLLP